MYEGEWSDNARHGQGSLRLANGFYFEGTFKADQMDGKGWCYYPDQSKYEGTWKDGKKDGRGSITFANGAVYEGRFRDDQIDGMGTLQMPYSVVMQDKGGTGYKSGGVSAKGSKDKGGKGKKGQKEQKEGQSRVALIPIDFQSDVQRVHLKAGFDLEGQ